jgi:hypothetical protein
MRGSATLDGISINPEAGPQIAFLQPSPALPGLENNPRIRGCDPKSNSDTRKIKLGQKARNSGTLLQFVEALQYRP